MVINVLVVSVILFTKSCVTDHMGHSNMFKLVHYEAYTSSAMGGLKLTEMHSCFDFNKTQFQTDVHSDPNFTLPDLISLELTFNLFLASPKVSLQFQHYKLCAIKKRFRSSEVFVNNTNRTFLSFCTKLSSRHVLTVSDFQILIK